MQGNPEKGIPSLENMFDEEIRQSQRMMANEREAIKDEVRREVAKEMEING